jgi:hypothetical protein
MDVDTDLDSDSTSPNPAQDPVPQSLSYFTPQTPRRHNTSTPCVAALVEIVQHTPTLIQSELRFDSQIQNSFQSDLYSETSSLSSLENAVFPPTIVSPDQLQYSSYQGSSAIATSSDIFNAKRKERTSFVWAKENGVEYLQNQKWR